MKVLMISTCPIGKNGITNVIYNLISSISNDNIHFDWLSIGGGDEFYYDWLNEKCKGKIFSLNRSMKKIISYFLNLKKIIEVNSYDIVHIHGNSATLFVELLAAQIAGCKVRIVHSHNTTCKARWLDKLLRPLFYRSYSYALACGREAGQWLFGGRDFIVINNGIDTKRYGFNNSKRNEIRKKYNLEKDTVVIGNVGVFNLQKNQSFLVDIIKQLSAGNYRLMLIGEGSLLEDIKKKVIENKLEKKVLFVGGVNDVCAYLSACDLICMPSLFEGLPLALVEEQANGLSCIVSDTITKEVDMTGNIVFLSLDKGAKYWANNIRSIKFTNRISQSKKAIQQIEQNGYSIGAEAKKLEELYIAIYNGEV